MLSALYWVVTARHTFTGPLGRANAAAAAIAASEEAAEAAAAAKKEGGAPAAVSVRESESSTMLGDNSSPRSSDSHTE